MHAFQHCISPLCGATFDVADVLTSCPDCGNLLDIEYDWDKLPVPKSLRDFEARWSNRRNPLDVSGVWRFRDLLPFARDEDIVTIGEGQTILQRSEAVGRYVGMNTAASTGVGRPSRRQRRSRLPPATSSMTKYSRPACSSHS